jgi:L-fuculose-phosphate aldolase
MNAAGLNQGTSGNISARYKDVLLTTPSATPYDAMRPESIAAMPLDGQDGSWSGPLKPSTEWRFHFDITKSRPDVGAIVHTHSTYATVLVNSRRGTAQPYKCVVIFDRRGLVGRPRINVALGGTGEQVIRDQR